MTCCFWDAVLRHPVRARRRHARRGRGSGREQPAPACQGQIDQLGGGCAEAPCPRSAILWMRMSCQLRGDAPVSPGTNRSAFLGCLGVEGGNRPRNLLASAFRALWLGCLVLGDALAPLEGLTAGFTPIRVRRHDSLPTGSASRIINRDLPKGRRFDGRERWTSSLRPPKSIMPCAGGTG